MMDSRRGALAGVLAGTLAAALALAVTSLADALSAKIPSLIGAVGQAFIRAAPGAVAKNAIETLGHADKPALRIGTIVIAVLLGAAVGAVVAARGRRWIGDVAFTGFGVLGVVCVASLHNMSVWGATVGAILAASTGALALRVLVRPRVATPDAGSIAVPGQGIDRRRFLTAAGTAAVAVVGARVASRPAGATDKVASSSATAPDFGAPVVNQGLALDGLSPLITPNRDFYRTDEALIIPSVNVGSWRLRIDGLVDRPFELTYDQLLAEELVTADVTLACVSNEVGGTLVSNAHWTGVRLDALLARAGVQKGADQIVGRSVDGFTAGFPAAAVDGRDALVAVAMNGVALPRVHGFPARLVVPGLYGYVSATKWLRQIELTTFGAFDAYWVRRGWARMGPIKVESRIDVPRDTASVKAGRRPIAGVAWAPHRGIAKVEVRIDEGPWRTADLGPTLGNDSWRQWRLDWDATRGHYVVQVRATTADGETQTADTGGSFPDGATGYHSVRVDVS
jgi:DMSO/TMAO reductase YedYZ molybdopterin-dependent catalytic subunit